MYSGHKCGQILSLSLLFTAENCKRNWKFYEVFASEAASKRRLVTSGSGNKYHVPNPKLSPFLGNNIPFPLYYRFYYLMPMRNSLVISILSIHWLPEMMALKKSLEIPTKVRQIECSRNVSGTSWKLFYDFHSVFAIDSFSPLLTTHDEFHSDGERRFGMGRGRGSVGMLYLRRLFWAKVLPE